MSGYFFEDDTHRALREQVAKFATREIAPHAAAWEEAEGFPRELYARAGEAALLGVGYPEEWGGAGGDITHAMVAGEQMILSGLSVGTAVGLGSLSIGVPPILAFGTREQKLRWLPHIFSGQKISALAISEPDAGSDVASIATRATRVGPHYLVNGQKTFVTSGTRADLMTTAVRTGEAGHAGISLLVIERGTPGFQVSRSLRKMGWRASDTAEIAFEECKVPAENLLGTENAGFLMIMKNFVTERLLLASQCVAIGELAFTEALKYARARTAFGRPLTGMQVTRHKLADMSTRIASARALTSEVAMHFVRGEEDPVLAAKAKNTASDALTFVVDQAVQIHGGFGYMREYVVERLYRDARLYPIGGGTREIMNEIISKGESY